MRFQYTIQFLLLPLLLAVVVSQELVAQTSLERSHYKYETVEAIYRDMVEAAGDGRTPPVLLIEPVGEQASQFVGAWINWKDLTITVEEELYDMCVGLGRDSLEALAFVVGHELAHFYKDHRWHKDFLSMGSELEIAEHVSSSARNSSAVLETEADYFGSMAAYMAGYDIRNVGPEFFDAFYARYQIPTNVPGYPSKHDRAGILRNALPALESMARVFDAGNLLLVMGANEESARCFDHLGRKFPSREIINNAGVARAIGALALFDPRQMPWSFPFEFDATTRLRAPVVSGRGDETNEARRTRLLAEARDAFQRALSLDEHYATARLNLGCVEALRGEYRDAEYHIEKAMDQAAGQGLEQTVADCRLARSILAAMATDSRSAIAALEADGMIASSGLRANVGDGDCGEKPSVREEQISGVSVSDFTMLRQISPDATVLPQPLESSPELEVHALRDSTLDGFAIILDDRAVVALRNTATGTTTARGASVGDHIDVVASKYGCPAASIRTQGGAWSIYEKAGIVFMLDPRSAVQGWIIYSDFEYR